MGKLAQKVAFFVKKKNWKIIVFAIASALVAVAVFIAIYHHYHPTHYLYNDSFIIGNTEENITERYGEFSKKWEDEQTKETTCAFYMIRDNTPELIMSYDNSLWYIIYFEDGVATKVDLMEGWYGG